MTEMSRLLSRVSVLWVLMLVWGAGCATTQEPVPPPPPEVPHELAKVSLPPYVIESPDILQINAIRLIPKPPYKIEPLDTIGIRVVEALPEQPIQGIYGVEPDGRVNLGFTYGSVFVQGMTLEQAKNAINEFLKSRLKPGYQVTVTIGDSRAMQLVRGIHLVQTDGTVNLGLYGSVYVDNMTIPHAKAAIEAFRASNRTFNQKSVSAPRSDDRGRYLDQPGPTTSCTSLDLQISDAPVRREHPAAAGGGCRSRSSPSPCP